MTVDEAVAVREALTGDAALIADLIEVCLNAEAALEMMGARRIRHKGFLPVGALTLNQMGPIYVLDPRHELSPSCDGQAGANGGDQ